MATINTATRAAIGARPERHTPAVDLQAWWRYLRWIFLTDCGHRPWPGVLRLVAVPELPTGEERDTAASAYEKATGR
jgi:hypothetical protein